MSSVDATKIAFLENERDDLVKQRDEMQETTRDALSTTLVGHKKHNT
jgi:hypothetical protein